MKITTNYLRQVIKEELEAVLAEEEKSDESQEAYKKEYARIINGLENGSINLEKPENSGLTADDIEFYKRELERAQKSTYGELGGEVDLARAQLAMRKATEIANKKEENPWQKAYNEKYNEIIDILDNDKINSFVDKTSLSDEELKNYRAHLNDRRDEPYGGSGDETDAKVAFAKETATKYANEKAGSAKNNS